MVRLTQLGWKGILFYGVVLVAFFASAYSNLFFLLVSFLTLLGLFGVVSTWRNLRGVKGEILELEPAPAGAGGVARARLEVPGRPRFRLECLLSTTTGKQIAIPADVVSGDVEVDAPVPPLSRGLYAVSEAFVSSTYPLGMLRARRQIPAPAELIIYATPTDLPEARTGSEVLAELCGHTTSLVGNLQPSGMREFRPGDDPRSIHWKASARRGELVIKEWEGGSGEALEIVFDRRCTPDQLEESLSLIAALMLLARDNKESFAVHSQDMAATFGKTHQPWRNLMRFLAEATTLPLNGPAPPPASPSITRLPLLKGDTVKTDAVKSEAEPVGGPA